jgi:hypothetical protein
MYSISREYHRSAAGLSREAFFEHHPDRVNNRDMRGLNRRSGLNGTRSRDVGAIRKAPPGPRRAIFTTLGVSTPGASY